MKKLFPVGDFENLLFTHGELKKLTKTAVIYENFDRLKTEYLSDKKILLLSPEKYVNLALKLKKRLFCDGIKVNTLILESTATCESFKYNKLTENAIICLGDESAFALAKYLSSVKGMELIGVPCEIHDNPVFSSETPFGEGKSPDVLYLDKEYLISGKRTQITNMFSNAVSFCLGLSDYQYAVAKGQLPFSKSIYECMTETVNIALNINSYDQKEDALILANTKCALIRFILGDFEGVEYVAKILKKATKLEILQRLAPLYSILLTKWDNSTPLSDPLSQLFYASEYLKKPEYQLIDELIDINSQTFDTPYKTDGLISTVKKVNALLPYIKKTFSSINGEKRKCALSPTDFKKGVKTASYFAKNSLLGEIAISGLAELITV